MSVSRMGWASSCRIRAGGNGQALLLPLLLHASRASRSTASMVSLSSAFSTAPPPLGRASVPLRLLLLPLLAALLLPLPLLPPPVPASEAPGCWPAAAAMASGPHCLSSRRTRLLLRLLLSSTLAWGPADDASSRSRRRRRAPPLSAPLRQASSLAPFGSCCSCTPCFCCRCCCMASCWGRESSTPAWAGGAADAGSGAAAFAALPPAAGVPPSAAAAAASACRKSEVVGALVDSCATPGCSSWPAPHLAAAAKRMPPVGRRRLAGGTTGQSALPMPSGRC